MCEKPKIQFDKPLFNYDQLEEQLNDYVNNKEGFKHDQSSIISIRQGIRAGRHGSVAVGGCMLHHDKVIMEDMTKANSPYHRTDLHSEMVLLNRLEDQLCDDPKPRMRDYTFYFTRTLSYVFGSNMF